MLTPCTGLQSFKIFLDGLLADNGASDEHVQILRDYLEIAKRQNAESETIFLPDVMETWSYAAHSNNDNVLSAVVVVLALLLKFISQRLDLTATGLGIGRTLLQKRQQELLARNLSADKSKEFIISPTLRLIREVVCLDGGTLAKPVFRARNSTFKALARNMGIRYLGEGLEDLKRPSGRTNAVRLFLSALKFLHAEAKAELLSQKELPLALTRSLREDPPYLIIEILDILRTYVVKDEKLPGQVKGRFLNSMTLTRFASLYHYEHDNSKDNNKVTVEDAIHSFLKITCTSPTGGILRPQCGYYPRHVDPDAVSPASAEDEVEPGLESITWMNKFKDDVPVRNIVLADFVKSLKPHSNLKQSELLLAIFEAAPELVAKYFLDKQSFTFDPKLSTTWIGYSAFLYKAIEQPIPEFFGRKTGFAHIPPPTSIIIDNIIPVPMSQKILAKCLAQKAELIPFIVMRLLVISMQKLQIALTFHGEAATSQNKSLWEESARSLIDEFCQRAPGMKEIITCYRGVGDSDLLQREAASRLLRLYYEVVPQVALMARFDVSPLLISAIKTLDKEQESDEDRKLRLVELENLLAIAGYSPGMRWFAKPQGLPVSPFVSLLKVFVAAPAGVSLDGLRSALGSVAEDHQLIRSSSGTSLPVLDALQSIKESGEEISSDAFWTFLDNCACRCATAPIKYLEMLQELGKGSNTNEKDGTVVISPFALALVEQLPFAVNSADEEDLSVMAQFVSFYVEHTRSETNDGAQLNELLERIDTAFGDRPPGAKALKKYRKKASVSRELHTWGTDFSTGEKPESVSAEEMQDRNAMSQDALAELLLVPSLSAKDNTALSKWASKEPDELVEEGYAASVISLLASEHISIRKEALISISKMAVKINESSYEENLQVWTLLSELVESCKPQVDAGPIPNTIVAFARHALGVLKDPHHALYGKINSFLTRGPVWRLDRLPLVYEILQEGPELDDAYYTELSWVLVYLLDGLLAEADMAMYHNTRLFERLLSLMGNPYMRRSLRMQTLKIIYRATCIDGGSTTLITRFGIVSWLEAQSAAHVAMLENAIYKALLKRIWETADEGRVVEWSKEGIMGVLARI